MPYTLSTSISPAPEPPGVPRTAAPGRLARTRLLLRMQVHWTLRAHCGYLQAAGFRWPRPVRVA